MLLTGIVIVAILAMFVAGIVSYVDDWSRDWTTNVAETSLETKDTHLRPLTSELSPQSLADEVFVVVSDLPRWSVESSPAGSGGSQEEVVLKLVHATMFLNFKDDVTVTIRGTSSGSILYARSQSRIGQGDLGQNPRNLRQLLAAMRRKLATRESHANRD